jgi:hypothetical protein
MTDPRSPDAFRDRSAAESADDKEAQRLVFDLLARGEATQAEIRRTLMRNGYHPGAWAVLRDRWAEDLAARRVPTAWRTDYSLKVAG